MDSPASSRRQRTAALKALASPARQELISEIGRHGASARELAERLGRTRQALHFHLATLEKAGLIRVVEERGEGREAERVYAVESGTLNLMAARLSGSELALAAKATESMLRLTSREFRAAAERGALGAGNDKPLALALRAKARLDEAGRERLHQLIREITDLFRAAKGTNSTERVLAMTLVLTPARESGAGKKRARSQTTSPRNRS